MKCWKCNRLIYACSYIEQGISSQNGVMHPQCFSCDCCRRSLRELCYIPRDDGYFCERCFDKKFSPQCDRCHLIISQGVKHDTIYKCRGKNYHYECIYQCDSCCTSLINKRYYPVEDIRVCRPCYKKAPKCRGCGDKVFGSSSDWHEECREPCNVLPRKDRTYQSDDGQYMIEIIDSIEGETAGEELTASESTDNN